MSLQVEKSQTVAVEKSQGNQTVTSHKTNCPVFIKSGSNNKIGKNDKKIEEIRAHIAERREKLNKIQNLLEKKSLVLKTSMNT